MSRAVALRLVASVLIAALIAPAAVAQQQEEDRGREIALGVFEEILGAVPPEIIVVRGEERTSYEVRLSEEQMTRMRRQSRAKNQQVLTAGRALSKPSSTSSVITGATLACAFDYYFWWSYVNYSTSDMTVNMTHDLKGPGRKFKNKYNHTFSGGSVAVVVENDTHEIGDGNTGVYTHQAKGGGLGGTGKTKQRYVATGTGC